ncbi:MAG: glycosyltransferase [Erysipelotrichales bacterium]|nr:glycosyltransferase [Erysipelotrichales bacterium]
MKKLALFQVDLNIGGIQKSCVNFLNNIDLNKYEVDLYLVEKDNAYINDLNKYINIKYIKKLPYITKLIPISILKLFYNPKIDKTYDIAIDFNSYSNETAVSTKKVNANKRMIWIHNDVEVKIKEEILYRILHLVFKSKYKYFDSFVGVSDGALKSFIKVNKIKNKECLVIPNLVDTKEIKEKLKEETEIDVDNSKINICSTGRIVHQKGFDLLVQEINKNKDILTNHHFYFIGGGSDEAKIKDLVKDNNLEDLITITGYLKNPYPLMNKMDAFILLSRYEGQGMVFLEAKALDLDVIMPKHLEKYVDGEIIGTDDLRKSLLNINKSNHKFNDLTDYNKRIINKINSL